MFQDISPFQYHVEYHKDLPEPGDLLLVFGEKGVYTKDPESLAFPAAGTLGEEYINDLRYLFSVDETRYYMPEPGTDLPETCLTGLTEVPVMRLRGAAPKERAFAAAVGSQLNRWYRRNRFCGACGNPMEHDSRERAMRCPICGEIYYPVIAPSVIVGVTNGEKLLVTRYAERHLPGNHYALVAGYIETGETPEDAVRREVMEEVGLRVKNIRYYKSQPWPFSGSMLLGYYCDLDGSDRITLEEDELSEGRFLPREELPEVPDSPSLTGEMIENFRTGGKT